MFEKEEYLEEEFEGIDFTEEIEEYREFDGCSFINCTFRSTEFLSCKFSECIFEGCELSLMKVKNSTFNDVVFKNSKVTGVDFSHLSEPVEIHFDTCNVNMSSFYNLDMRHAKILNSSLHDVDFVETNLEKADCSGSDFMGALFGRTNLKSAKLSSAKNYMINPNENIVTNMEVSLPHASSFFTFLGLKVN